MTNVIRAELLKLTRPRILIGTFVAVLIAAVVATSVTVFSVEATDGPAAGRGVSLGELAASGGGTEAFSLGMSFSGFFVFVTLAANWASEFSQGTFRTLLMKQPRRTYLLAGKLTEIIDVARPGAWRVACFFAIHQLVVLSSLTARATWYARALRLVATDT